MRLSAVKFVNHADDHPEDPLLRVRRLPIDEVKEMYQRLAQRLDLDPKTSPKVLLRQVDDRLTLVRGADAESADFNPLSVLDPAIVASGTDVLFTLGEPEEIWRISRVDLSRYFDSIWYSGPDDLTLFDSKMSWIIGISHEGAVRRLLL